MSEKEIRICEYCGGEYIPRVDIQRFCSPLCKCRYEYRAKHPHARSYKPMPQRVCRREDCKLYTDRLMNHCMGLDDIPPYNCKFYKENK